MLVAPSSPPQQSFNNPIAMPNVMVHPPEEEDTPAWCLYDAAQPQRSHSFHQHHHPLFNHHYQQNAPPYAFSADDASPEYSQEQFNEMHRPTGSVAMINSSGSPHGNSHDHQRSFVDLLENNDGQEPFGSDSEYGDDIDDDAETLEDPYHQQAQQGSSRMRDAANDSDVIEVVKVSRRNRNSEGQQHKQQTMSLQKAATLKSRASKVFKSLLRSKPSKTNVPDVPPLPASAVPAARPSSRSSARRERDSQPNILSNNNNDVPNPSTISRSNSPTVSRKGSRVLSQLFSTPAAKPHQSVSSLEQAQPPSPTQPSSPQRPEPTPVPVPIASPPVVGSRPSYASLGKSSHRSSVYHESQPPPRESYSTHRESLYEPTEALDQARLNASSPTPTTASTASKATRRFSKLNLARLFTFSGPSSSSTGVTSNSNPTPAVEGPSSATSTAISSHSALSPVDPVATAAPSKDEIEVQECDESGRTTPTSRNASQASPSAASSVSTSTATTVSTSKTANTTGSESSSASDSTSGPQTPITSEPELASVKVVNPPSSLASSPPSIYSLDSYRSRDHEPAVPIHNLDSIFETDKSLSLSLNLGLGIDLGGGTVGRDSYDGIAKGRPSTSSTSTSNTSKKRISSAGAFGSFISGKRGSRVFSAPGGMMRGHSKQSMDKMQEDDKEEELEMRLDSLHFEELSFDMDKFKAEL
ncbi:hypothetical protein CVT24_006047 [Panaeolus cyanescens]|uniref:Uncharacterized protein n=1 Tax=Panaeolus cyanescens TaxID=181874 RepID=A0A409YDY9_9AGAR|nr:hypothetical protein CVT24_006047 [Panaeolus cyanescens]